MNASTLTLIAEILKDAEAFIAGQAITINVPSETIDIAGEKVVVSAVLTIKKG